MKNLITYSLLVLCFYSCNQKITDENTSNTIASVEETKIIENNNDDLFIENENCKPSRLKVYLNDPDTSGTNIRKTPKGEIVTQLIQGDPNFEYFITITEARDGWFKVEDRIKGMESDVAIPNGEGWIHGSVISVDTRNYVNQPLELLDKPENGKVTAIIEEEVIELRLKDLCGDWTKVQLNKAVGWIENKWLCGNPLTTCS